MVTHMIQSHGRHNIRCSCRHFNPYCDRGGFLALCWVWCVLHMSLTPFSHETNTRWCWNRLTCILSLQLNWIGVRLLMLMLWLILYFPFSINVILVILVFVTRNFISGGALWPRYAGRPSATMVQGQLGRQTTAGETRDVCTWVVCPYSTSLEFRQPPIDNTGFRSF